MDIISFLRQFRVGGFAIFDFVVAFWGIFMLSPWLSKIFRKLGLEIPKRNWLFLTLPIGIVVHLLIGRKTPLTADFIDLKSHYFLKIIIIALFILGMRGIRRLKNI